MRSRLKATDGMMLTLFAYVAVMLVQLIASVAMGIVGNGLKAEIMSYIFMILFQVAYLGTYLNYARKRNLLSDFSPRNRLSRRAIIASVLIAIVCFFGFIGLAYIFDKFLGKIGYAYDQELPVTSVVSFILLFFCTVIAAPIGEEMIFRCALLSGLTDRMSKIKACFISALCFMLMHGAPQQTAYQFCLGFVCAYVVLNFGSVIPAIIIHAGSNALAILMSFTKIGDIVEGFYMKIGSDIVITLIMCILLPTVAAFAIYFICKAVSKKEQQLYPEKFGFAEREKKQEMVLFLEKYPCFFTTPPVPIHEEKAEDERLKRLRSVIEEYESKEKEKSLKTWNVCFCVFIVITVITWLMMLFIGISANI